MRIHTKLIEAGVYRALGRANAPAVFIDWINPHGSRTHKRAYEVRLGALKDKEHTRRPNTGNRGAAHGDVFAATYDEWGRFLAQLFEADPDAKAGPYKNRDHFHAATKGAYA